MKNENPQVMYITYVRCFDGSLQVSTLKAPTLPILKFLTYPSGQGAVYNIIVEDPKNSNMEAAYSPVATYGCPECGQPSKIFHVFRCFPSLHPQNHTRLHRWKTSTFLKPFNELVCVL